MAGRFGGGWRSMCSWRVKRGGVIAPDERFPSPNTIALEMQHVLAMFGATFLGAGGYFVQIGDFTFAAIGPADFAAILLWQVLRVDRIRHAG